MINIQVTLRLWNPIKTFRKSVKLFAKIDIWAWEWLQTWLVLSERQCDKPCGRSYGRTKSGCCIRTMPQLTTPFCSGSFFPINALEYFNILHICGLAPCDFFLYTKVKSVLKGTHFPSVEEVNVKTAQLLNGPGGWWAVALLWTMEDTNAAVCR